MADEATTNMLMKFHTKNGLVAAECPLLISPNDDLALGEQLAKGFTAGAAGTVAGTYFLVSQFSFGAELHDNERAPGGGTGGAGHGAGGSGSGAGRGGPMLGGSLGGTGFTGASFGGGAGGTRGGALARGGDHFDDFSPLSPPGPGGGSGSGSGGKAGQGGSNADGKSGAKKGGSFARWRSTSPTDATWTSDHAYPAYINEFAFTRLIDKASPVLFDFCCRKESFPFVTFIKRKAAVAGNSVLPESLAYLRIDLANVLLTGIRWSDGDIVEESCQMICQKMRIIYWQQNFDSTLTPIGSVDWAMPLDQPPSSS
jgi:type VI protein secretion system component Hcp